MLERRRPPRRNCFSLDRSHPYPPRGSVHQPQGTLNAAIAKHDPKARPVNKLEDFAYIRDATALLAFQDLGVLDKGQKTTLGEALDLRNRCGHPTKYTPGVKKASSFIEDVLGIVFA